MQRKTRHAKSKMQKLNKEIKVQELPCVRIFLDHFLFFFFLDLETKNQDFIKKAKNYQVSLKWNKSQLLNTIKPGMT
jgi:hypothetical protein